MKYKWGCSNGYATLLESDNKSTNGGATDWR